MNQELLCAVQNSICHCLACRMTLVLDDARYRLDEGIKHTKFMLFRCKNCGKAKGIPEENLQLFLTEGPEADVKAFVQEHLIGENR